MEDGRRICKKGNEEDYNPEVKRDTFLRKTSNHRRHINPAHYLERLRLLFRVGRVGSRHE
jgi:hypothetical protein